MSRTISFSFITNLFRNAGRKNSLKIERYSCDSLAYANTRLAKMYCPHCDVMSSFDPMEMDEQSNSFKMCRVCGLRLVYDNSNALIGSAGFVEPQHSIYLDRLNRDAAKRTALIASRRQEAYRRYEMALVANNPVADEVLQEVESMEAKEALSAYMADKVGVEKLREAA